MDAQKDSLNIAGLKLFNNDNYLVFIYKKTQGLINAVYMVTNLFPEAEPLKWSIRNRAVTLLEDVLSFPTKTLSERKNLLRIFTAKVLEIVSLSEISSSAALMSGMNFQILKREFQNLISLIEQHEEPYQLDSNFVLDQKLFQVADQFAISDNLIKRTISRTVSETKGQKTEPTLQGQNRIKDKDTRQEAVFSLLKDKNELSIKDISSIFKDCSEKTLQRELQRMVGEGRLKKTGERRWSRYSLI